MTDPTTYGLNKRTQLRKLGDNKIGIVKLVKSRIIRKDAQKIIEMAEKIKATDPNLNVLLICTKNICSKSITLLEENNIEILYEEPN